ncbi:DUF975 family protein [Paenibacillus sp. GD4]|uniref:DUF975 family protein n=1 Tax=Paenibacillus sp. GD4 TaxID=3068890 RepID=UPI002796A4E9|nr:DUF975 family protein [Paenibacillus sp. GD4]MDQ1914457.1 DUF975 family protein [Paenibacillus sp. GD4]
MWTRAELKARAKEALKGSYWKAFLASLVIVIATGGLGGSYNFGGGGSSSNTSGNSPSFGWNSFSPDGDGSLVWVILAIALLIGLVVFVIVMAFRILLGYPLEVGGRLYFKQAAEQDVNLAHIVYSFDKGRYWDIIKAMFWRGLLTFLWYLLLIIPGIVKTYAYSLVPYILSDNPNIGYKRAVELSKQMTAGHKFRMWVLDLSFIGWYLLGLIVFFVGIFFVMPYVDSTKAELYRTLRRLAIQQGITSEEELRL